MKKSIVVILSLLVFIANNSFAENRIGIFQNSCESYKSSEDFVKSANGYCLKQSKSRACFKEARAYFKDCGYEGDFKSIAHELQKKLLVMLIFSNSRDLGKRL